MRKIFVYEHCRYCGHTAEAAIEHGEAAARASVRQEMGVHVSKCIANPNRGKAVVLRQAD
jgi:hypothetical protein